MKWRIFSIVIIVLLVAILGYLIFINREPLETRQMKARIKQYKTIAEEQKLIRDILAYKIDISNMQAKFKPAAPKKE